MENDTKIRLRDVYEGKSKGEAETYSPWRFALTIAKTGYILSSTTNAKKAAVFSGETVNAVIKAMSKDDGMYKNVQIEMF